MKEFIQTNYQFLILCCLWIVVGAFFGTIPAIVLVCCSVILLKQKDLYYELFLGFIVLLILSDSRTEQLAFAERAKVFYLVLLSIFLFFDRKNYKSFNRLFYLFLPFFLISLFLVVKGNNWLISFEKYLSFLLMLLIVPNYIVKLYEEYGSLFFRNLIFLFSLILLLGLIFRILNPDMAMLAGRYRGIFGNPNGMGLFCILFFVLFYLIQEYFIGLFSKPELIFIYTLIIISILLCRSRNAILSILCFLLFIRLYRFSPYVGFLVLCTCIIGYELILQNFETIIQYVGLGHYFRLKTINTGSGREIAWTFAWKHIQDNFFLGKGFAYDEALFHKNYEKLSIMGHQGNVHNSFLTIWLNTGIIGLIFFLRGFFLAFLKGAANRKIAFPVMFVILFSANFESWMAASLNPITIQLWIILTIFTSKEFNENKDTVLVH